MDLDMFKDLDSVKIQFILYGMTECNMPHCKENFNQLSYTVIALLKQTQMLNLNFLQQPSSHSVYTYHAIMTLVSIANYIAESIM